MQRVDDADARMHHAGFGRSVFDVEPFWRGEASWGRAPAVDIANEKAYEITAELPESTRAISTSNFLMAR